MIHWLVQTSHAYPELARGVAPVGLLSAREQKRLAALRAVKRRHDWLLGRWTAKLLLQAALIELQQLPAALDRIEIDNDAAGAPYARLVGVDAGAAPAELLPISLSISHSGDRAFCALYWHDVDSAASIGCVVGCDIECIEPREASFVRTYFTEAEAAAVAAAPAALSPLLVTALWSAKEAVLKAWRIGLRVDTRAIDCDLDPVASAELVAAAGAGDSPWQPFSAQVSGELDRLAAPTSRLDGWWRVADGYVMTLAVRHVA